MTEASPNSADLQLLDMAERLAGVGHWRFDVASGKVTWSRETYRIHGIPPTAEEPDYKRLLDLYDPESAALLASLVERALATGDGYELEARIRRPDGAVRYVAAKAECSRGPSGEVDGLFGVFQDITERTQAEHFMRALANHIPAMVGYWDRDLRCRYANEPYREWFGRSPSEMLGISIQELMGDQLFARNEPFIRAAMLGQPQTFERTLTKPSGETGHTLAQYIPDKLPDGRVEGMVVLVTDITLLKKTEYRLEQAVTSANEALRAAEAALNVKREFLSNISHELRNPLTGIIGFAEVLAGSNMSGSDAHRYLGHIRKAGNDLLTTVNDLLDFSKLEAGQVDIEMRPFDPRELARSALEFFEPRMREKSLSPSFDADDLPATVLGDETRIRQILLNFIGNAAKFTAKGGVTLHAGFDHVRNVLKFAVADTGPGIPRERQSELFQRFAQVDASVTRKFGGTGLGLAICKGLAEAMGGAVGLESELGKGSCFWVEIPCSLPLSASTLPAQNFGSPPGSSDALAGMRLLIADDHAANRELVRQIVQSCGVFVIEARGGAEAASMAESEEFDFIVLDVRMPDVDGVATAHRICSRPGPNRTTPIFAFTADTNRDWPAEWRDLFTDRLAKPIVVADLLNVLARHAVRRST